MNLTYPEIGATRNASMPDGYVLVERDVSLGAGPEVFERAVAALLDWRMHQAAGLALTGPARRPAPGLDVVFRAGWGPIRLPVPCRVVYIVEEPSRRGFAYGTLPGHPERGEEAFLVVRTAADDVRFQIRAFSRPASLLARAGGPVGRAVQRYVTDRYVRALRLLAGPSTAP